MPKLPRKAASRRVREAAAPYSETIHRLAQLNHDDGADTAMDVPTRPGVTTTPGASGSALLLRQLRQLDDDADEAGALRALSRGQRKRLLKKEKLQRKYDFVQFAKSVEETEAAKRTYGSLADMSSLSAALETVASATAATPNTALGTTPGKKKTSRAARAKLREAEIQRFQSILNFSAFQDNPVEAIKTHLQNTLRLQKTSTSP